MEIVFLESKVFDPELNFLDFLLKLRIRIVISINWTCSSKRYKWEIKLGTINNLINGIQSRTRTIWL